MTRARTLADMISDGVIGTTELADDAITPVKLDETGSYAMAGLTVDTNTLHVDSANNRVGIGTTSPASQAHIYNAAASANLRIETDADAYASISFLNDQSNWGAGVDTANHFYVYDSINSSNVMEFGNNDIVFNQTGKDYDFRVESDSRSNALVLDGGTGGLALNTTNSDFYTGFDTTSIKLGPVASMWSLSNGSSDRRMTIDQNLYVNTDGTNRYLTTGAAARYQMNTGTHRFETAPSGSDDAAATSTVQMLIENDGEVRMLPSNTDAQNLKFRTTSTAGRSVIKSITREDSGSVNPMSQLQMMAYGTNSYLGQMKIVLNSSDTYNSSNQNNVADFKGTGGLVLNESGLNYLDFRVESDNQSHMLFLDASANSIGIRNSSPDSSYIIDAIGDTRFDGNVRLRTGDKLEFADTNDLNIYSDGTTNSLLRVNNGRNLRIDATGAAGISQLLNPSTGINIYYGNNTEAMRLNTEAVFNETGADRDFRVEGSGNTAMIFVDASADRVMFGGATNVENSRVGVLSAKTTSGIGIIQNQLGLTDTSDMAAGVGGGVTFNGRYLSSGGFTNFGSIEAKKSNGTSGQYGGQVVIKARRHGGDSEERISFDQTATVVNQDGHDNDFRVESDNNANMFLIDAGIDKAAFGTSPQTALGGMLHTGSLSVGSGNHVGYSVYSNHEGNVPSNTTVSVMDFEGPPYARYMKVTVSGYLCRKEVYFAGYQSWDNQSGSTVGSTTIGTQTFANGSNAGAVTIYLEVLSTSGTSGNPKYRLKISTGGLSGQLYDTTSVVEFFNPPLYVTYQ